MENARTRGADALDDLRERVIAVRHHVGLSANKYAGELGISSSFYWQVENKGSKPPTEVLLSIARIWPNISLRWLLTGVGSMFEAPALEGLGSCEGAVAHEEGDIKAEVRALRSQALILRERAEAAERELAELRATAGAAASGVEEYKRTLERELARVWSLGDVAIIAQRARCGSARELLTLLAAHHPMSIPVATLLARGPAQEVLADLALLLAEGSVVEDTPEHYRSRAPLVQLGVHARDERSQQALEAAEEVFTRVLPKGGRLVLSDLWVKTGAGRRVADRLLDGLRNSVEAESQKSGTERITLVVGVVVDTGE